ncbi:MAG: DUF885 domain-containing protein [Pseudohongiellaceae bacterium]
MFTARIPVFFLLLLIAGCGESPQQPGTVQTTIDTPMAASEKAAATGTDESLAETARLNAWFNDQNEERLTFSPIELTMLGRKTQYDEIDQMSIAAQREYLDWFAASVAEMEAQFDYELLDFEAKTSYDLWRYIYTRNRDAFDFFHHEYIFEQMDGAHSFLPVVLLNYHSVASIDDMQAYITRIGGIARALGQQLDWAQTNAERGVRPPRFAYELVIDEAEGLLDGAPFTDSDGVAPLWADVQSKIQGLADNAGIDADTAANLREQARAALVNELQPAYTSLVAWLEQDLGNTDAEPQGVHALPDGENYYRQMLSFYTTTDLSAEEIHQIGLQEVERLSAGMEAIKDEVGFVGTMQEFFRFINTDEQFFYSNTDAGRQQFLADSAAFLADIEAVLPEYFGIQPQAELVVKRVEAFREQDGAPAHYYPSSEDGSIPGVYYAHLSDMTANPNYEMESVAYHEGLPGHHMQIAIAQELESVPDFRGQFFFNAYTEGWGLYSEQLAYEMGQYRDPYSNFGRLSNEMWRAVRLVVDTGLHAMGWSEQQAIDFFAENAATPLPSVIAEVRRYLVLPGQATSYKIGMLKILELRERAQTELGENFDIRDFHDVVLGGGALPLEILERRVVNYIDLAGRGQEFL